MLLKHITRNLDFFRFFHLAQLFSSRCTMCNVRDIYQFNVVLVVLAFQCQRQDSRGIKRCQARNTKLDCLSSQADTVASRLASRLGSGNYIADLSSSREMVVSSPSLASFGFLTNVEEMPTLFNRLAVPEVA